MILKKTLLIILITFFSSSFSIEKFFQFKLADIDNQVVSFSGFINNKATVIVFLLSDCPASQSYTLTLNKLSKKYNTNKISFVGVFPGRYSTDDELKKFKRDYKITFPLLKDPDMILAKNLNAKVGPSCFLINDNGITVYKGRIDDWLYAVGKKRQIVTENNLEDAIKSVINNKPIKISETIPIGCILEYEAK